MSDDCEIAWAAGLFEGEGTATSSNGYPRLALRMTDHPIVRRFAAVVGHGTIYGPYENRGNDKSTRKPVLMWVAAGAEGLAVAELLEPWLGDRRRDQIASLYGARQNT